MLNDLVKGILPPSWRRYTVPRGCTVIQWITDFSQRVKQLQEVSLLVSQGGAKELKVLCLKIRCITILYTSSAISCVLYYSFQTFNVWLGGLLNPEAYITATRQCIAQANSWSLEELVLDVTITDGGLDANKPSLDDCSFGVVGKFSVC